MSNMNTTYKSTRHAKFLICYHFIWCPKYRTGILDNDDVVEMVRSAFEDVAQDTGSEIIASEIMPDHVHLSVSTIPAYSPSDLVARFKSKSGSRIAAKHPDLKRRGEFGAGLIFAQQPVPFQPK